MIAPDGRCEECGAATATVTLRDEQAVIDVDPFPSGHLVLYDRDGETVAYAASAEMIDRMAIGRPRYRPHICLPEAVR
jgi:hypothetical protein